MRIVNYSTMQNSSSDKIQVLTQSFVSSNVIGVEKYIGMSMLKMVFQTGSAQADLVVLYSSARYIEPLCTFLKCDYNMQFLTCIDIFGSDLVGEGTAGGTLASGRFLIVYNLYSNLYNIRVCVRCFLGELEQINSILSVYLNAGWYERECWDMYGIRFVKHSDLRRILTDYGFIGHPLRRDFPVVGSMSYRFDVSMRTVVENRWTTLLKP